MKNDLTPDQLVIATASANRRLLVLAGPGTGKTHTLVHRLLYLVQDAYLAPARELLVLSFSRTAVAEVRSRLEYLAGTDATDDIRFINVRTFDSFATRLLTAAGDTTLHKLGYDARIQLAVHGLSEPASVASEILKDIRHVIVDEIQDLVGVRALLVQQIIQSISGGYTLFGDPAQSIYDFQIRQSTDGPTSLEFLKWLKQQSNNLTPEQFTLTTNHRIATNAADVAAQVRPMALEATTPSLELYLELRRILESLPSAGSVKQPDISCLEPGQQRVAILCRTNADVLFTASALMRYGLACIVPPTVEERGLPAWIARIFATYTDTHIHVTTFRKRWASLIGPGILPGPDEAWQMLNNLLGDDRADLDLNALRDRLRNGVDWIFDSEAFAMSNSVLVSTIHQSKGREYDVVAILRPHTKPGNTNRERAEEARLLYVACTRARSRLLQLDHFGLPVMLTEPQPSYRKRRVGQNRQEQYLFQMGVSGDLDNQSWVERSLHSDPVQAHRVQNMIWKSLIPGTHLQVIARNIEGDTRLILVRRTTDRERFIVLASFDLKCKLDLENLLMRTSSSGEILYPNLMEGLIVIERTTILLPPFLTNIHEPYATSGFCLGLNVRGVLQVNRK